MIAIDRIKLSPDYPVCASDEPSHAIDFVVELLVSINVSKRINSGKQKRRNGYV